MATTGEKEACIKCSASTASVRALPCKDTVCLHCVQELVRDNKRSIGLKCPKCNAPFTVTVLPQDRRKQELNRYVKDDYRIDIQKVDDRGPLCLNSKIMGMTILGRNLFVVCQKPPNVIFKFNLDASNLEFSAPVELSISEMKWPRGIASSEKHNWLYITDWSEMFGGKLWRYKHNSEQAATVDAPVATLDVQPFGVSVSPKGNEVLVACATPVNFFNKMGWIYIFKSSDDDFSRVRTIELPDLEIPRHAILTSSSHFLVCHGWSSTKSHGVTSFRDAEVGPVTDKYFYGRIRGGGSDETDMNRPLSLTFDKDGMILVVDYFNHRVQLLTEDLQLVRHLLTKEVHSIEYPRHVCQDPKTGRLYLGQENGKIEIFNGR